MNERIKELMKQADYPAPELALRAQKLAELIVRDCGRVYIQNQQDGVMTLTEDLLHHFGIKE
jgi:hypothetical protein